MHITEYEKQNTWCVNGLLEIKFEEENKFVERCVCSCYQSP